MTTNKHDELEYVLDEGSFFLQFLKYCVQSTVISKNQVLFLKTADSFAHVTLACGDNTDNQAVVTELELPVQFAQHLLSLSMQSGKRVTMKIETITIPTEVTFIKHEANSTIRLSMTISNRDELLEVLTNDSLSPCNKTDVKEARRKAIIQLGIAGVFIAALILLVLLFFLHNYGFY